MARVLLLFAHPRPDRSEVNLTLFQLAREVEGVTAVDLYAEYPDFEVDVDREQERLCAHDVVIFQHPVYWYSCPALLKEWMDLVLEHGFAFGTEGRALVDKVLLSAVTCGARREAYRSEGAYQHELRTVLLGFEQTARLCNMRYLAPFALFAAGHAEEEGSLEPHLIGWRSLLQALVEDRVDLDRAAACALLAEDLDRCILQEAR